MPFPIGPGFPFQSSAKDLHSIPNGLFQRSSCANFNDLMKAIVSAPAQYTRLISLAPAANKPGELHRIMIVVIEIGSFLTKHNSSYLNCKNTTKQTS